MVPAEKLAAFTAWAQAHITGDEKGQAQIFLDRLGSHSRTRKRDYAYAEIITMHLPF